MLSFFFKHNLSFFEARKLNAFGCFFEFLKVKNLLKLGLIDQSPGYILQNNIFQAISQTSFDILATHRNNLASGRGNKRVGPDSAFYDRIFAKAVHSLQLHVFLLDFYYTFLDNVKRIGVVTLVEYKLFFLISLGKAAAGQSILLVLGQIFEEGEHFQKFFVLLLVNLVDIFHNLLKCGAADDSQLAVANSKDGSRPRSVVDDA